MKNYSCSKPYFQTCYITPGKVRPARLSTFAYCLKYDRNKLNPACIKWWAYWWQEYFTLC